MKNAPADTLAHYLNELRIRAGLSVRNLALACGYKTGSGVQRYLEDPTVDRLSLDVGSKIALALYGKGEPPIALSDLAPLIGAEINVAGGMSETALAGLLQLPVASSVVNRSSVQAVGAGKMPVIGAAHASFWMPIAPSLDDVEDWLTIPFGSSAPLPGQYALRIVGPSINKVATEGMFAICEQFANGGRKVPEGKYVHAQRERNGEVEWTLKLAKWTADGLLLCPNSDHKDHQKPLKLGEDGDTVSILGIVIGWYRPA